MALCGLGHRGSAANPNRGDGGQNARKQLGSDIVYLYHDRSGTICAALRPHRRVSIIHSHHFHKAKTFPHLKAEAAKESNHMRFPCLFPTFSFPIQINKRLYKSPLPENLRWQGRLDVQSAWAPPVTHAGRTYSNSLPLLYVKQQEGCYIILVYEISLIIESLFLYHAAFLKERNTVAKNLIVVIPIFLRVHTIINLL